jgi:hypothetical protein
MLTVLVERNFKNLYTQYILRSLRDQVSARPGKAMERFEEASQSIRRSREAGHSKKSEEASQSIRRAREAGHSKKSEEAGHSEKKLEESGHSENKAEETGHSKKKPEEAGHSKMKPEGDGHSKMMSEEVGRSSDKSEEASHSTRRKGTGQLSATSQQLDTLIEQLDAACTKLQHVPEPHGTSSSTCPPHHETDEHENLMKEKCLELEMKLMSIGERMLSLASAMSELYRKNELNL